MELKQIKNLDIDFDKILKVSIHLAKFLLIPGGCIEIAASSQETGTKRLEELIKKGKINWNSEEKFEYNLMRYVTSPVGKYTTYSGAALGDFLKLRAYINLL